MVAPIAHGYADRPVKFRGAQRGTGRGDRSMVGSDTNVLWYPLVDIEEKQYLEASSVQRCVIARTAIHSLLDLFFKS